MRSSAALVAAVQKYSDVMTVNRLYKVTVTNLSLLAMEEACNWCWATLSKVNWKRPFVKPMPGVMQDLDKFEKWVLPELLKRDQTLPTCFRPFHRVTAVAPIGRLEFDDPETGLFIYGYPDVVLENDEGGVYVIDNKTAKPKEEGHPLYYAYQAQLGCYCHMIQHGNHDRRVDGAGLFYYRRSPDVTQKDVLDYWIDEQLCPPFKPTVMKVELDFDDIIRPLIDRAYGLLSGKTKPEPNPECPDCALLEAYLKTQLKLKGNPKAKGLDSREQQRLLARQALLERCTDVLEYVSPDHQYCAPGSMNGDGILANWDFSGCQTESTE